MPVFSKVSAICGSEYFLKKNILMQGINNTTNRSKLCPPATLRNWFSPQNVRQILKHTCFIIPFLENIIRILLQQLKRGWRISKSCNNEHIDVFNRVEAFM